MCGLLAGRGVPGTHSRATPPSKIPVPGQSRETEEHIRLPHGLILHGLILHGLILHGLILHGSILHGLILHGLILHGLILHGLYNVKGRHGRPRLYVTKYSRASEPAWPRGEVPRLSYSRSRGHIATPCFPWCRKRASV